MTLMPQRRMFAYVLVLLLSGSAFLNHAILSPDRVYAASGSWAPAGDGDWDDNANWNPGPFPNNSSNDIATFGPVNSGPATVTIRNTSVGARTVIFQSDQSYALTSAGGRTLTTRQIDVISGTHTISVTMLIPNNLIVNQNSLGELTIARTQDNAFGRSLRYLGAGTLNLYLSGNNNPGGFIRSEANAGRFNVYGAGRSAEIVYNPAAAGGVFGIGEVFGSVSGGTGELYTVGGMTLQPNVTMEFDINGPNRGATSAGYDTFTFSNSGSGEINASLNNAALAVRLGSGYTPVPGDTFALIERMPAGTGAVLGTFGDLPDGSVLEVDNLQFLLRYNATNGVTTSVTLARVDLPGFDVSGGATQQAVVGNSFGSALEVTVIGANGSPVEGVLVTFSAPSSGAAPTFPAGNTARTDANGRASVLVSANTVAGSYQVTANTTPAATSAAVFNLTNLAGAPSSIVSSDGDGQSAMVNTPFATPLRVTISDAYGNPVSGAAVEFSAPAAGASATFPSGATALTNAAGYASIVVAANGASGNYQVEARVAGVATPAVFDLVNTGEPRLTIALDADARAFASMPFVYRLSYANTGAAAASGATLRVVVPHGATFHAPESTAGWTCIDGAAAGSLCTLNIGGPLAPGAGGEALFGVRLLPFPPTKTIDVAGEIAAGETNLTGTPDDTALLVRPVMYRLLVAVVLR